MRPVSKGTNPPYTDKTTFTFGGDNIAPIKKLLNRTSASNVPIADCLNLWLAYVIDPNTPPNGASTAQFTKGVSAVKKQVGDLYKLASVPLTQRLGPFCSFCESPLTGLLEVEHCVPKAPYPTFSNDWDNFLLACNPCNTAKSNTPSRATAQPWTGVPTPNEAQYYAAIRTGGHYVWADLEAQAFAWLPPALEYYDTTSTTWKLMRMDMATNLNNQLLSVDISTRTVTARIYTVDNASYLDLAVRAVIVSENGAQSLDTINTLLQLNADGNQVSTYDRRMLNRTQAWFTCLQSLLHLSQITDPTMYTLFWNQMLLTSVATGFYSVWLEILKFLSMPHATQFVTDTNKPLYYPGTNATSLP